MRAYGPIEAEPRTPDEVAGLPPCPDIVEAARRQGIKDVLHFTSVSGAVGILATNAVKSRSRLTDDQYLEHVYSPNAPFRKDEKWLDYVNLSIARINDWMFGTSERWHVKDDTSWVVLSFDPEILGHPGVVFTTTNNIYPTCRRAEGRDGFEQLFTEPVYGRYSHRHDRSGKQSYWTTDRQAEVLYPGQISCDYLQRVDVQLEETVETLYGILAGVHLTVPVRHAPEVFI